MEAGFRLSHLQGKGSAAVERPVREGGGAREQGSFGKQKQELSAKRWGLGLLKGKSRKTECFGVMSEELPDG